MLKLTVSGQFLSNRTTLIFVLNTDSTYNIRATQKSNLLNFYIFYELFEWKVGELSQLMYSDISQFEEKTHLTFNTEILQGKGEIEFPNLVYCVDWFL